MTLDRMPFGKHRGRLLSDIDADYLRWVLRRCASAEPALLDAVRRELAARGRPDRSRARQAAYCAAVDAAHRNMRTRTIAQQRETTQRTVEVLLAGERSGTFVPGPQLDALWHLVALSHADLHTLAGQSSGASGGIRDSLLRALENVN